MESDLSVWFQHCNISGDVFYKAKAYSNNEIT